MTLQEKLNLDPLDHEQRVLAWRRARVARLTARDSWLSLVGKHWLHDGDNAAGSGDDCPVLLPHGRAPQRMGVFNLQAGVVRFSAQPSVALRLQRSGVAEIAEIVEPVQLTTDLAGAPDRVLCGELSCEIMQREQGFAVRVRDPESPTRKAFSGLDYFPIRHDLRVLAELDAYTPYKPLDLAYDGGASEHYESPGRARFELDGVTCELDVVLDGNGSRLLAVFADATNRDSSYGAGRFLYAPLPVERRVVLDFNQAFNPPCAFTPHALCPLPPQQNRLAVRIEAGEKRPRESHENHDGGQ